MMKYKTYVAPTLQRAILQMVLDMGKDAIIVSHRDIRKGGIFGLFGKKMVEITAALPFPPKKEEEKMEDHANIQYQTQKEPKIHQIQKESQILPDVINIIQKEFSLVKEKISAIMEQRDLTNFPGKSQEAYQRLINNDVIPEVASKIIKDVVVEIPPNVLEDDAFIESRIINHMSTMIKTENFSLGEDKPKIVVLMGPTGVGKTTTLAKIAADFVFEKHKKVAVITIDTYRIAAAEQLKIYTDILDIPFEIVYFPSEFKRAIDNYSSYDLILVDTAGRSQRNSVQMAELKAFISQVDHKIENHLLLSSTTKYKELVNIVENFQKINFHKIIFTKIDEALSFGSIFSIAQSLKQPIIYFTTGQNVPEDIEQADATKFAKMVFG